MTATYVYCVVNRDRSPALTRVPPGVPGGSKPRAIKAARGAWLVVSDVPLDAYGTKAVNAGLRDMEWVSARAMAHEAVVEHCSRRNDVVPMKLFTMFRDDERAISHVANASLRTIFRKIAGCREWSVRVNCAPAAAPPAKRSETRRGAAAGRASGAAFLRRKQAQRDDRREAAATARGLVEQLHGRLSRIARASVRKEGDVPGTNLMLDAAFLLLRTKEKPFQRELQRLSTAAARAGCDIVLSGPWPAYHFVTEP